MGTISFENKNGQSFEVSKEKENCSLEEAIKYLMYHRDCTIEFDSDLSQFYKVNKKYRSLDNEKDIIDQLTSLSEMRRYKEALVGKVLEVTFDSHDIYHVVVQDFDSNEHTAPWGINIKDSDVNLYELKGKYVAIYDYRINANNSPAIDYEILEFNEHKGVIIDKQPVLHFYCQTLYNYIIKCDNDVQYSMQDQKQDCFEIGDNVMIIENYKFNKFGIKSNK